MGFIDQKEKLSDFENKSIDGLAKLLKPIFLKSIKQIDIKKPKKEINRIAKILEKLTLPILIESAEFSFRTTNQILSLGGRIKDYEPVVYKKAQLKKIIKKNNIGDLNLKNWFKNVPIKILERPIIDGISKGYSYDKIIRNLSESVKKKVGVSELRTIVVSYSQALNAKSRIESLQKNKKLIETIEWSAIMENGNTKTGRGTCPRCMALDGIQYEINDLKPPLPLHPLCRCMFIPVMKDFSWLEQKGYIDKKGLSELNNSAKRNKKNWYGGKPIAEKLSPERKKGVRRYTERNLKTRRRLAYGITDKNFSSFFFSKNKKWRKNAVGKEREKLLSKKIISFDELVINDEFMLKKLRKKNILKNYQMGDLILIDDLKLQ